MRESSGGVPVKIIGSSLGRAAGTGYGREFDCRGFARMHHDTCPKATAIVSLVFRAFISLSAWSMPLVGFETKDGSCYRCCCF